MTLFVELTPPQARVLMRGWQAEDAYRRHTAEPWSSQAARDKLQREGLVRKAVSLGVPLPQVLRFVMADHQDYEASS